MVYHKRLSHVRIGRHVVCSQLVVEDVCDPRVCCIRLELEFRGYRLVEGATAGTKEVGQGHARNIPELPEDPGNVAKNHPLPQRGANGRRMHVGGHSGSFGCQPPGGVSMIRPLRLGALVA